MIGGVIVDNIFFQNKSRAIIIIGSFVCITSIKEDIAVVIFIPLEISNLNLLMQSKTSCIVKRSKRVHQTIVINIHDN